MTDSFVSHFDVGLFDLDGVCYLGADPVVHAPESISEAVAGGMRQAYVTNNASRTPAAMAAQLSELGIPAAAENVISSSLVASQILAQRFAAGSKILVIGTDALRADVEAKGFTVVDSADDQPAAVILGFTPDMSWKLMSEAALAIRGGAVFVATNLDRTIPRERGLMIGNGSIAKAIENSTGVVPISAGKPEPEIFLQAAQMLGASRPFAVGDNLDTDIQGAVCAGIPVLHVLTGLATARDVCLAVPAQRPNYLADDLRCMLEPYPDLTWDGDTAVSGHARAHWTGSEFELSSGTLTEPLDLDSYRVLASVAWKAVDSGVPWATVSQAIPELTVSRSVGDHAQQ